MKLHVRYKGQSQTFEAAELGLGPTSRDDTIKQAVSSLYEIPAKMLRDLAVDRSPDGIVVRPPAVFG